MRRVPIDEPSVGAHRPEVVAGRIASDIADNLTQLQILETRMATMDETLADMDNVVAAAASFKDTVAATVRVEVDSEYAGMVAERLTAMKVALGLEPAVDPNADPNLSV